MILPHVLDYSAWMRDLPLNYKDGLWITPESREWKLMDQRIQGDVIIGRGCSHFLLQNLYIEGGIIIEGLAWHGTLHNVWQRDAETTGILVGNFGHNDHNNALTFINVFARSNKGWGWECRQQIRVTMIGCGADQNQHGGFLYNNCSGRIFNTTCESNLGDPIAVWDCPKLKIYDPFFDPPFTASFPLED